METSGRINHRIFPGRLAFRRSGESRLVKPRERAFELVACDSHGNSGLVAAKLRADRIQSNRSALAGEGQTASPDAIFAHPKKDDFCRAIPIPKLVI
jgi:hypothetical protein